MTVSWNGVFPALMTEFHEDESLDLDSTARHIDGMIDAGCTGIILLGTLGENVSLRAEEKREVLRMGVDAVGGRVPLLTGTAEYTAAQAIEHLSDAAKIGCDGAMLLPPMVYGTAREETLDHFRTCGAASDLPIMIYNNPVSYKTDVTPEMFAELSDVPALVALKESSDDTRRITDIQALTGDRYTVFCGVDDLIVEAMAVGAAGWVAGLVNAFPTESVQLYDLVKAGRMEEARAIYRWFMPMLHLDCLPKLVQYIKLANQMTGLGSEWVRRPRMPLAGDERERIAAIIQKGIDTRPQLATDLAAE